MNITVRSIGLIRQILGQGEIQVLLPEGTTVGGLLSELAEEKGEKFAPYAAAAKKPGAYAPLRVVINGRDVLPQQSQSTMLAEGDDVLIFVPIAGG
ncbi:MAG: MoaD/ThiS family protein [Thermoleophilia bacterium]|nr:MoaD/ThiS family protein [Thermoleophilia bacterium]